MNEFRLAWFALPSILKQYFTWTISALATALVITDTQQAGLQKYAFEPPKSRHPCRFCTFSFDVWVEQHLSYELERQPNSTRKDKQNAIHGHRQSLGSL
jgi:hypothetical protein